jgi:site-specific DNA recombinase
MDAFDRIQPRWHFWQLCGNYPYYEIIETEADVVRKVFHWYTVEGLSIAAIARQLTESGLPTRKQRPRWERSVIWAILRNPAYQGRACFGKTAVAARQRITRPLRLRGGSATRNSANGCRPSCDSQHYNLIIFF